MASGINGPGANKNPSQLHNLITDTDKGSAEPVKYQFSFDGGMAYIPAAVVQSPQDAPAVAVPETMDSHLSFSNLMSMQNADIAPPRAERRSSRTPASNTGANKFLQTVDPSIYEEFDKVFADVAGSPTTYRDPTNLQLPLREQYSSPEVLAYHDQRFSDADYSSHRRTHANLSKPLSTRLSNHDIKSLKSRTAAGSEKEKKNRRRHRSSSSSSSRGAGGASSDLPSERKIKRKGKKKKNIRKPLTAPVRQRTLSIPEENEEEDEDFGNESEEEDEEEDEEVCVDDEEDVEEEDDDKGGDSGSSGDSESQDSSEYEYGAQPENRGGGSVRGATESSALLRAAESVDRSSRLQPPVSILLTKPSPESQRKAKSASFELGGDGVESQKSDTEEKKAKKKKKKHKKHHQRSSISERRASGIQLKEMDEKENKRRQKNLSADADFDTQNHRYEMLPGVRKHLLHRPVKKRRTPVKTSKVVADRKPHEVFVELDELVSGEWKETARWIKFEEDVEESQKWGKPRVASLSFHSLLELRRSIERGAILLDLPKNNLTDIANCVVELMVNTDQIRDDDRGSVLRALLSKHKHLPKDQGLSNAFSHASFSNFFHPSSSSLTKADDTAVKFKNGGGTSAPLIGSDGNASDVESGKGSLSRATSANVLKDLKIMKKIPWGAEATAVLVGSLEYLEQPALAFVRLSSGVDLENVVALPIPVRFIFVLLGPTKDDFDYHEIGRSISTLMSDEEFHVAAYQADTKSDLLRAINEFLDDSIVLPPGQLENPELLRNINLYQQNLAKRNKKKQLKELKEKKEQEPPPEDPLQRTKKCFGGLIRDVKRRYPQYLSDIKDAFNAQCLAAFIFIYFGVLSPAITFGGLLGESTYGLMGVSEMIVSCCFCGCMMGLFGGQPILIVGATGPIVVFEEVVYGFCISNGLPYLATRFWIGMWISIIATITVAFEGSFLIRFVTRFTQDIFTVLVALIFIFATFEKLFKIYAKNPLMESYCFDYTTSGNLTGNLTANESLVDIYGSVDYHHVNLSANQSWGDVHDLDDHHHEMKNQPNTALLSTILMFGTYIIAMELKSFKNSKFFRSSVRRTIGDFGVPIAILVMVLLDSLLHETYTQKLQIPDGFSPTNASARGWLISPFGTDDNPMPVWMIFAACLPAFLVFILIFLESHITELILSSNERCLKKGTGFHLDIMLLGCVNGIVSVFGLPWVCASTVKSITHINSLTVMSQGHAPGERPRIVATLEQRLTGFGVNAALGLSILMAPLLRYIPTAVLFGIFLYMGVGSVAGVQMIDRVKMLFMPVKYYPDFSYVKIVRPLKIHIFTIIEIVCLVILWVVKSTALSIAFPFFLILTVPLRLFILPKFFTKRELSELDSDGSSTLDPDDFEDDD